IEIMGAMLHQEPAPLNCHNAVTPTELQRIVTKALRRDRERRYQTSKDMLLDLKSLTHELEFGPMRKTSSGSGRRAAPTDRSPLRKTIDSLAVLPFANVNANPSTDGSGALDDYGEYFGDGITESVINMLSRLPEMRVMAWSTVSQYKGRQDDPREIGRN